MKLNVGFSDRARAIARHADLLVLACVAVVTLGTYAAAQVAGSTTVGVVLAQMDEVANGWSAKKQILNQPVLNEHHDTVGIIEDLIVAPDKAISYAIVGAGGFAGIGRHDVAIPINQFKEEGGKFVLAGATKEAIKALPRFEYAK